MKRIIVLCISLAASIGFAADGAEKITQRLVEDTMDRGMEILKDDDLGFEDRMQAFEMLLKEKCHTDLMAKLVLGRSGWGKLTEEQHPEFISSFIQMVTRSYYTKMDMADVTTVEITYGENQRLSANKRALKALVKDTTAEYEVEYKVALIDGQWGVYDLVVEGISLLASYRSEYADYLQQHSGTELIELLKQKAAAATEE